MEPRLCCINFHTNQNCWLLNSHAVADLTQTTKVDSAFKEYNAVKLLLHEYCTSAFPGPEHCELRNHACLLSSKLGIGLLLIIFHSKTRGSVADFLFIYYGYSFQHSLQSHFICECGCKHFFLSKSHHFCMKTTAARISTHDVKMQKKWNIPPFNLYRSFLLLQPWFQSHWGAA